MKILQMLLVPPGFFLLLMAMGFLIRRECRTMGSVLVGSGFILLYLVSIGPVSFLLMEPLERNYKPLSVAKGTPKADALLVLGGGVRDLSWLGIPPQAAESSLERVAEGVRIYRFTRLPLVLVGGSGDPVNGGPDEAAAMVRAASGLGVPDQDIVVIDKVNNTRESAFAVKRGLKAKRIILVTSAFHMARASGMFTKLGFDVVPAPCGFRAEQRRKSIMSFLPSADRMHTSSYALSEYIGLAWYTMSGAL